MVVQYMDRKLKLAIFILMLSLIYPLFVFNGSIDDFSPKHIAKILETSYYAHIQGYTQMPGYYSFGAVISTVLGISSDTLLFAPIQLLPFVVISFSIFYKLTNSYLFSIIVVFTQIISGVTGDSRVFYSGHGLGYLLFYSAILITILLGQERRSKATGGYLISILLIGSSLVFISYNLYTMLVMLLVSIGTLVIFIGKQKFNVERINGSFQFTELKRYSYKIAFILIVVQLGLSEFFYKSMIPTLIKAQDFEISGIDKFLNAYFSTEVVDSVFFEMLLSYPKIISLISGVKYILLFISIFLFILSICHNQHYKKMDVFSIFVLSLLCMAFFYSLIRLHIGGIIVTIFALPGLLCTLWFYNNSEKLEKWSVFVILLLLILNPAYSYIQFSNNLTNKDTTQFDYLEAPAIWHLSNKANYTSFSDELTKDFFILHSEKHMFNKGVKVKYEDYIQDLKILPSDSALSLVKLSDSYISDNYFIINYKLNSMSLQNWLIIKPWRAFKEKIDMNVNVNKIYDSKDIAIYF